MRVVHASAPGRAANYPQAGRGQTQEVYPTL